MQTLDALLSAVEKRPPMYLGGRSLSCLKSFIDGWMYARGGASEDLQVFDGFQRWVQQRFGINTSQSWAKIILFFSQDDSDALDSFFRLFNEYRQKSTPIAK